TIFSRDWSSDVCSSDLWFVLGRNIYQAACGNAQKALEFIRDIDIQLARFPEEIANHILSGALFEVYFDGQGVLRSESKSEQIDRSEERRVGKESESV